MTVVFGSTVFGFPPLSLIQKILEASHAYFQLPELALADGSTGGHDEKDERYAQEQEHDSIHQQSPFWKF